MTIKLPPTLCNSDGGVIAKLTCWLQGKAQFLCEKEEPDLSSEQRFKLSQQYMTMITCGGVMQVDGSLAYKTPEEQRNFMDEYMDLCPGLVVSEYIHTTLSPTIPARAKIAIWFWKKFTFGTDCHCCWSYRVIALALASFVAGLIV